MELGVFAFFLFLPELDVMGSIEPPRGNVSCRVWAVPRCWGYSPRGRGGGSRNSDCASLRIQRVQSDGKRRGGRLVRFKRSSSAPPGLLGADAMSGCVPEVVSGFVPTVAHGYKQVYIPTMAVNTL